MSDFVKSATTTTSVAKSQSDIMAMLSRYSASGFGFRRNGEIVSVTFHMPRAKGQPDITVEIPINLRDVEAKLGDRSRATVTRQSKDKRPTGQETHAERVAWRVLYLWIDAALAAVSLGAQTIEEAFFAHIIVTTEDGKTGRLVDYVGSLGLAENAYLPRPERMLLGKGS